MVTAREKSTLPAAVTGRGGVASWELSFELEDGARPPQYHFPQTDILNWITNYRQEHSGPSAPEVPMELELQDDAPTKQQHASMKLVFIGLRIPYSTIRKGQEGPVRRAVLQFARRAMGVYIRNVDFTLLKATFVCRRRPGRNSTLVIMEVRKNIALRLLLKKRTLPRTCRVSIDRYRPLREQRQYAANRTQRSPPRSSPIPLTHHPPIPPPSHTPSLPPLPSSLPPPLPSPPPSPSQDLSPNPDLTILCLNTHGRLAEEHEVLWHELNGEDILVFTETWLGHEDPLPQLPGYVGWSHPRETVSNYGATRGGIAIYVQQGLAPFAEPWMHRGDDRHDNVCWIRIHREAGLSDDLYIAGCYFPPETGPNRRQYRTQNSSAWDCLQTQLPIAQEDGGVILAGDFNARTGQLDTIGRWSILGSDSEDEASTVASQGLRRSPDKTIQPAGKMLLARCEASSMTILNGRITPDHSAAFTCHPATGGHSVVDYFIACEKITAYATLLQVIPTTDPVLDHEKLRLTLSEYTRLS